MEKYYIKVNLISASIFSFFIVYTSLGPVMLASTAVVNGLSNNGCSRVESDHSLDVCPFVEETVSFNCQYAGTVPLDLQALAGDVILFDNTDSILSSQMVLFSSTSQNGEYSCRATNPVCSSTVASQNFNIAVLGEVIGNLHKFYLNKVHYHSEILSMSLIFNEWAEIDLGLKVLSLSLFLSLLRPTSNHYHLPSSICNSP